MKPPGAERSTINIQIAFKAFSKRMEDIWESYNVVAHYGDELHQLLKKGGVAPMQMQPLMGQIKTKKSVTDLQGALSHLKAKANPKRTLLDAFGTFEHYLSVMLFRIYQDYPDRLQSPQLSTETREATEAKILNIILDSQDKDEIIERIAEERIRGKFYGKPTDVFVTQKVFKEFGGYFKDNYGDVLKEYAEIAARRNILTHQGGKIDRKYIREVPNTSLKLGQVIPLPYDYLKNSLSVLTGIAAIASKVIVVKLYTNNIKGKLRGRYNTFHRIRNITPKPII